MKVKGWKKISDTGSFIYYRKKIGKKGKKDTKYQAIFLQYVGRPWGIYWDVTVENEIRRGNVLVANYKKVYEKKFKTKSQALKFAKNWMKKHPRGCKV